MNSLESSFLLRPSLRDTTGVGCFTTEVMQEGIRLYLPSDTSVNRRLSLEDIPDSHLKYCPLLESGEFLAPANFALMSVFWYINHDREPNVLTDNWRLFTARDIEPDEELVMYYPDLQTHPKNKEWVIPDLHI